MLNLVIYYGINTSEIVFMGYDLQFMLSYQRNRLDLGLTVRMLMKMFCHETGTDFKDSDI